MARDIKEKTLKSLLEAYNFSIPDNQRKFEWNQDNATELLDDLLSEVETYDPKSPRGGFFLGNIITLNTKKSSEGGEHLRIVDGQQRITTITILLIALRVKLKPIISDGIPRKIQEMIMVLDDLTADDIKPRFAPSNSIAEALRQASQWGWNGEPINKPAKMDGREFRHIKGRFDVIYNTVSKMLPEDKAVLVNLYKIIAGTIIVHIDITRTEEAIDLFERTNARGAPLDVSDLLKNFLFGERPHDIKSMWNEIEHNAQGKFSQMLRYYHVSEHGYITKRNLYKRLKAEAKKDVDDFLINLEDFSKFYDLMINNETDNFNTYFEDNDFLSICRHLDRMEDVKGSLEAIKFFKVKQAIPLIYSLLLHCKSQDEQSRVPKQFIEIVQLIEKFHFKHTLVCKRPGNLVEKMYAEFAPMVANSEPNRLSDIKDKLKVQLVELSVSYAEFIDEFKQIRYDAAPEAKKKIHYIFDRYYNFEMRTRPRPDFFNMKDCFQTYNIDHIYPQRIENDYAELKDDAENLHSIGNLFLLKRTENGSFQNIPPVEKIQKIQEMSLTPDLTKFLEEVEGKVENWNADSIQERAETIGKRCFEEVFAIKKD